MDAVTFGKAGLKGWRARVADAVAGPVAQRTPVSDDQVRAAIGALFLALSVMYVTKAVKDLATSR
ncbi:hypothetical protein SAMN04515665_10468 [Blastococcus sp. DSM 46786]|uniref:hypothetical protein n=1 Tax=Blastococcus sp. DSM 46786 TaxID=1798227 RepID=UPI0008C93983|nr:hypothetical protein [Blastococcus sp. DSM 46786]SEK66820.1 hypothetical protein SAMN04515665_10468 [Blastococcus sp. DSM 46786]